jgi:hydrogenase-4 component E
MPAATDIAHLAGGAMLVLTLLILAQRRTATAISAYAVQSGALALAVAAQAWAQHRAPLAVVALLVLGVKSVLVPIGLRHVARAAGTPRGGTPVAMAFGVGVVVLAVLAVRGAALPNVMAREDLAASLSVTLLGLLVVITRQDRIGQMLGFLSSAAGCTLAIVSLPGLPPLIVLIGSALLLIPTLGVLMVQHHAAPQ